MAGPRAPRKGYASRLDCGFRRKRPPIPIESGHAFRLKVDGSGAAPDDLLELDHRVDWPHQYDVAHIARIDPGGPLLRRGQYGQYGRDGLLVVLEVAQVLPAEGSIVGGDAHAVVRVGHRLALVDRAPHGQRVRLRGAEHRSVLARVYGAQEDLHTIALAGPDLDEPIEVPLLVAAARLDVARDDLVVWRRDVLVERGGDLPHLEGREEAIVDALPQRVLVHRLAEIGVGVGVHGALGRSRQAQLNRRAEVVEDRAPAAFVVGPAAVALVGDDEVEEVRRVLSEVGLPAGAAHEGLARAGGQREQDAIAPSADGLEHAGNGDLLVVAPLPGTALVLERDGGKTFTPRHATPRRGGRLGLREGLRPERLGAGEARHVALGAGGLVDAVDGLPVGAVGEAHRQLCGVALGLRDALRMWLRPGLGLHHRELGVAVDQRVVGDLRSRASPLARAHGAGLQAPERDAVLAQHPAAFDHAPVGGLDCGVGVLGAGFGFVHAASVSARPRHALCQDRARRSTTRRGPSSRCNPSAEEVPVLVGPDRAVEQQRTGEHGPVARVTAADPRRFVYTNARRWSGRAGAVRAPR